MLMDHHDASGLRLEQPWLHDLAVCVDGNVTALSAQTGQIDGSGAQGVFVDDRRILGLLTARLGGRETTGVAAASSGACSDFLGSARHLGDEGPDPTVEVRRLRQAIDGGLREVIRITSRASQMVETDLVVRLGGDGAPIGSVKAGMADLRFLPATANESTVRWQDDWHAVTVVFDPAPRLLIPSNGADPTSVTFSVEVPPGATATVTISLTVTRLRRSNLDADAGSGSVDWANVSADATDPRLRPTLEGGLRDLQHLLLTDPADHRDVFAGAGTPWYLTLFGRDSLWAARMVLPFGTDLARGTLRALARRQGTQVDQARAESPGKIPHEVRRAAYEDPTRGLALPPVYYGTIDATALWISLLHDAWHWGMSGTDVEQLMPNLRAASHWLTHYSAPDSDELLKYVDLSGTGLANQGWKDSADAIRWRDGRVADAPIALVEAQGYAIEAANAAADLFDAFGQDGAIELRQWAADLRDRVRARFWVGDGDEPYLGIAVDGHGQTVDGVASNMGHMLGTGALTPEEVDRVARTLTSPEMLGAYGVGTLARDNGGFNPIGYHTGSIWTHDTAICAWGLAREGRSAEATEVARTLLASAAAFDYHWPELYVGTGVLDRPAPYPASCRPQAWSAASAAVLVSVALGFEPDAQSGRLTLRPSRPAPYGAMTIRGLRFAGRNFGVQCQADGTTQILDAPTDLDIRVQ
jgi:glycogen debranching enzyme